MITKELLIEKGFECRCSDDMFQEYIRRTNNSCILISFSDMFGCEIHVRNTDNNLCFTAIGYFQFSKSKLNDAIKVCDIDFEL